MKVFQFPLIKISLFFVLGILFAFYLKPQPVFVFSLLLIGFTSFGFSFYKSKSNLLQNNYFGVFALLVSFFIGISSQTINSNLYQKNHYYHKIDVAEKQYLLEISLKEKLKFSEFNNRFVAKVKRIDNKNASGKIILNIRKDSSNIKNLEIGALLKIKASFIKNKPVKNPNQFDYGKYLENQNIYAQVYCDADDIEISSIVDKNIWFYTAKFRTTIIQNLEKNGFSKKELAVIVALILGQQQDISLEILQDYQFAGAVHILSVSGLHVGFILLFVGYLLKPFPNTKKWKLNKLIIVILSLWLFGFVAGLAPSVLRSVVMFSFVAIGRYLGRGVNIYNTLLVSAIIILLFQPSFLFDVGFQLSYVSLFFIIWLQPLLENIWEPKNKFSKFFWEIITVSFAAQIGAMGLSIYYFHQFPGLFFITNLIIMPVMGFILGYGVLIMILAYFGFVPIFLMNILEWSVFILNQVIAWIASFEQFILKDISLNKWMLCSLYLMIFAIVIYFKKPKFNKLAFALMTIILFQLTVFGSKFYYQNQKELVVFNSKKNSIIIDRFGQKTTIFAKDSVLKNIDKNLNVKQYLVGNFSKIKSKKQLSNLLFFNNKKILILDSILINSKELKPDILIITSSPKLNLERFLQICHPKTIVVDGSNFKSYVKVWKTTCEKSGINFHSTTEKGFFRL